MAIPGNQRPEPWSRRRTAHRLAGADAIPSVATEPSSNPAVAAPQLRWWGRRERLAAAEPTSPIQQAQARRGGLRRGPARKDARGQRHSPPCWKGHSNTVPSRSGGYAPAPLSMPSTSRPRQFTAPPAQKKKTRGAWCRSLPRRITIAMYPVQRQRRAKGRAALNPVTTQPQQQSHRNPHSTVQQRPPAGRAIWRAIPALPAGWPATTATTEPEEGASSGRARVRGGAWALLSGCSAQALHSHAPRPCNQPGPNGRAPHRRPRPPRRLCCGRRRCGGLKRRGLWVKPTTLRLNPCPPWRFRPLPAGEGGDREERSAA